MLAGAMVRQHKLQYKPQAAEEAYQAWPVPCTPATFAFGEAASKALPRQVLRVLC